MADVDIKVLFESGAHFGHKTSRWHPKMEPYIHSKRGGSHIINLEMTVEELEKALDFVSSVAATGKQVLFVGTKQQAKPIVKAVAEDAKQPYVNVRWLGGMLTNNKTIGARVKHLVKLEERMDSGELANRYSKLEVQRYQEEIDSLNNVLGGIKNMNGMPGAVYITDVAVDKLAVMEAKKLGIPTVAIVDTNADPTTIDYPIPANDDAIKTLQLITELVGDAVKAGTSKLVNKPAPAPVKAKKVATPANAPTPSPTRARAGATPTASKPVEKEEKKDKKKVEEKKEEKK